MAEKKAEAQAESPKAEAEAPKSKPLTADDVRAIVREELGRWKHDADHTVTAAHRDAQRARDVEAGVSA